MFVGFPPSPFGLRRASRVQRLSDFGFWILDWGFKEIVDWIIVAGSKFWVAGLGGRGHRAERELASAERKVRGCKLPVTGYELRVTSHDLLSTCYLSLVMVPGPSILDFGLFKSISLCSELVKGERGDSLDWHTVGCLRLASSRDHLKALQREVSRAKAIGLAADIISPREALDIFPPLSKDNLYGAVYMPDDGYIDPSGLTYELVRQARKMGVEMQTSN